MMANKTNPVAGLAAILLATAVHGDGGDNPGTAVPIPALPFNDTGDTSDNTDFSDETCPYPGSTSPDEWYSFSPSMDEIINISLCESGYDTKLYVYDSSLNVVACDDDACSDSQGNPYRSLLYDVPLIGGHQYYIVVDGYGGDSGPFELELFLCAPCYIECPPDVDLIEGEPPCGDDYEDHYNGGCHTGDFQPISCGSPGDPFSICGETGTFDYTGLNYRDTDWYEHETDTVTTFRWSGMAECPFLLFIIDGTEGCAGMSIIASGVGAPYELIELETIPLPAGRYWFWAGPSVFDGWDCGQSYVCEFICGDAPPPLGACCLPDGSCQDLLYEYECMAMNGTAWHQGMECFAVECLQVPPNDYCADAIPLAVPEVVMGYTTLAHVDDIGCSLINFAPSVWYSVIGTGNRMTATTCGAFFDYDTKLDVYCAGCEDLFCITGNNDDCTSGASSELSTVTWCSEEGQEYLIVVSGHTVEFGEFELQVFDDGEPCTDQPFCDAPPACDQCSPSSIAEGEEDCYDEYVDVYNGGCDSTPPMFLSIECGETYCGTFGSFELAGEDTEDSDWYVYYADAGEKLTCYLYTETQGGVTVYREAGGLGDCEITQVAVAGTAPCEVYRAGVMSTEAGYYYFRIQPFFWPDSPCDSRYNFKLTSDACTPPCPADVNHDSTVDVLDLLAVLAQWGPCPPVCIADTNDDGVVDVLDLLNVLGSWGPCP